MIRDLESLAAGIIKLLSTDSNNKSLLKFKNSFF